MSLCQKADQKAVNHISLTNNHLVQFSVDIINKYAILFDAFSQELHIGMIAHVCTIGLFKFYSGFTDSGPMCSAVRCDQRSDVISGPMCSKEQMCSPVQCDQRNKYSP